MPDNDETKPEPGKFDFSAFPADTLFYDRRSGLERRDRPAEKPEPVAEAPPKSPPERRARKERRRRIDPTTFEKQYTDDEMEFMTAVQQFKTRTGKSFPTHGDVLRIAASLGYRKSYPIDDLDEEDAPSREVEAASPAPASKTKQGEPDLAGSPFGLLTR
jgi:hypothetical protein